MLDLQKAFDTVDHEILCSKLECMGIDASWFQSYLTNRSQVVKCGGSFSESREITCGVPQGSILGPLLFLCYVNDMSISIDDDCKLILYADDSAILFSHADPRVISEKLGKVLENCSNWLVDNRLSLHLGKTECILFGPSRKLSRVSEFQVKCHNHVIKATEQVKYLGVRIDNLLKGTFIIEDIIKKVNTRLKFLYRNGKWLDQRSRSTLATALIQCYFDYCCSSWFEGLSKAYKNKLQVLQNKTIRFILSLDPRTHISWDIFNSLKMLPVSERVSQLRLNHVYNVFHGLAPPYLCQYFELNSNITRGGSNMNFQVPRVGTYSKSNFYYKAILEWNSLPLTIKQTNNKDAFKKAVKEHLSLIVKGREESAFVS